MHRVELDGELLDLTPKEFDLLAFLAASPDQVYSREELLEHVWGSTQDWQDPATVTEHVRRLRLKLEADPASPSLASDRARCRVPALARRRRRQGVERERHRRRSSEHFDHVERYRSVPRDRDSPAVVRCRRRIAGPGLRLICERTRLRHQAWSASSGMMDSRSQDDADVDDGASLARSSPSSRRVGSRPGRGRSTDRGSFVDLMSKSLGRPTPSSLHLYLK